MASPGTIDIDAVRKVLDGIALELVLAEPGKDNGLLPVNSLLAELEVPRALAGLPDAMTAAIAPARQAVDSTLETGAFDPDTLDGLRQWVGWMQEACDAVGLGRALPAAPAALAAIQARSDSDPSREPVRVEAVEPPGAPCVPPTTEGDDLEQEAIVLPSDSDRDLLREFASESAEHLTNIELGVLALEENPRDAATLHSIFRAFHTFKGGSGFLNLQPIHRLAHELESLLDLARQERLVIDGPVIDLILAGGDALKRFVADLEARLAGRLPGAPIVVPVRDLLARVRAVVESVAVDNGGEVPVPSETSARADSVMATLAVFGADLAPDRAPVPSTLSQTTTSTAPPATSPPKTPAAPGAAVPGPSVGRIEEGGASVKVDTRKLDSLVDLVGEMVIAESMVLQDPDLMMVQSPRLCRNLAQLGRVTRELQRVALSLRMVPIRSTFQKMTRLVRDLSVKAGKQVVLKLRGEDTELDRTIIEEIRDPLVHMIRNAVDHGIEHPEARRASGKSPDGLLQLRAFHRGGSVVIEVEDDGAGLPCDRILRKAIEKGIVPPGERLSDADIQALIFAPGFSTADKVTDLSGRGVGMDVVRRNIEKLRGKVEIHSVPGSGSRFTLSLPLTLAIIDGLLVSVGTQRYVLPTLAVRESFRPTPDMLSTVQGRAEVVNVRGRLLPLLRLHTLFGIEARAVSPAEGIVLVVESERECRCLLVDDVLGKQEVVVKSLAPTFKQNRALAGAAILGDGKVGLILDIAGLLAAQPLPLAAAA